MVMRRDPSVCYLCGIGTGVCEACKLEHLGQITFTVPFKLDPETVVHGTVISGKATSSVKPKYEDESDYEVKNEVENVRKAQAAGMKIIEGDDYHLTLDLDNEKAHIRYQAMYNMVKDKFGIVSVVAWHSKTGSPHIHAVVELAKAVPVLGRCALQAAMGSDPKRETFATLKYLFHGVREPCLLFQPDGAEVKQNWDGYDW